MTSEPTFDPPGPPPYDDDYATRAAAELAEAILDEVSRARHNWSAIARMASSLTLLAVNMAAPRS